METFARQYGVEMPRISGAALETLVEHPWPGNVRELKNVVERIVIRHQSGEVDRADLPLEVLRSVPTTTQTLIAAAPKVARQVSEALFDQMVSGRQSFWSVVYAPFISRDLTRDDLRAIIRKGLEQTSGNYRVLVELFNMPQDDYKRFLGFLRKYQCHVPFQEFRSAAVSRGGPRGGGDRATEERSPDRIAASI
jgi:DNA-binding NtrC family response regulator